MVVIRPHQTAVSLFSRHGLVTTYPSLKAALAALGYRWIVTYVGSEFTRFSHTARHSPAGLESTFDYRFNGGLTYPMAVYIQHDYVLRDDDGGALTAEAFDALRVAKRKSRHARRYAGWNGMGPVPFTGKRPAGRHYFRHFRHMNAYRGAATFIEEGEVPVRAKRSPASLPNVWDDCAISARRNKSWKRHRRTQWHEAC